MSSPFVRRACSLLALTFAALSAACESSAPLAPQGEPVVLMGRVSSLSSPAAGPATASGSSSLSGIEVSVEGAAATTITDDSGNFRLEVEAGDDTIVLRFRRGALDVRMELAGVASGTTIRLEVRLSDDGGEVIHRDDDHDDEDFEGRVAFVSLTGDAPARTLRVELTRALGPSVMVDVVEGSTVFDAEGDVLTFAALLAALDRTDVTVRIEGDGDVQDGGARVATFVKVETDEHQDGGGDDNGGDDDDDPNGAGALVEFEGAAELVSVSGLVPTRTVRVRVLGEVSGEARVWLVDLVEGETSFDATGDLRSVGSVLTALASAGTTSRLEGHGTLQGDVIVAATARAEVD